MEASIPILWISVILPLLVALVGVKVKDENIDSIAYTLAATLLLPVIVVIIAAFKGLLGEGLVDPWMAHIGSVGTFALTLDGLSSLVIAGVSLVTAFVSIYSIPYMKTRVTEMKEAGETPPSLGVYFFLYSLFSVAMLGLVYATNMVLFYIFLELTLLPSFLLIAYYGYGDRKRIAILYLVWTHIGAVMFLSGVLYYGFHVGNFDYLDVNTMTPITGTANMLGTAAKYVALLMVLGLFVKMAVFGFHMWLPYAHAEAPTPISALLSPNLIGLAGYALARITVPIFPTFFAQYKWILIYLAFTTIIYGGLVALKQTDFKRFLAYSSISQMGYMLLGIATLTPIGITGAMIQYLSHALGKALLFMTAGVFITELHGLRDIRLMGGLARKYPLTAALALLGFMHLVGMPPTIGMWSELFIVFGLFKDVALTTEFIPIVMLVIVALMVSASYSFVTMRRIFYNKPRSEKAEMKTETPGALQYSMLFIGVMGVVFFLWINPYYHGLLEVIHKTFLFAGIGG
ncbi:MAG: NADH-quinone oxidoreductase subunit M [Desulfurococcales archaeon]|nr:NADH-quinone oxidoreductase subunit M [Desulfurococcales archaeon]